MRLTVWIAYYTCAEQDVNAVGTSDNNASGAQPLSRMHLDTTGAVAVRSRRWLWARSLSCRVECVRVGGWVYVQIRVFSVIVICAGF